ncbi:hypothetical protein BY458DRAFT_510336 [Sporodiniella umbellata]|nr:hypothetical protein BY458DRAFT_510336 [Sporodiniella umbellata]
MVDVVGFSALTNLAAEKGDSGAEAVALEIGSYMGECIEIIEHYGGDVVKFLGDAVLVSFQTQPSESSLSEEKNRLVRRALECGTQLLARLSHYRVYLTAEERSKHRLSVAQDRQNEEDDRQHHFLFDSKRSTSEQSSIEGSLKLNSSLDIDYTYDANAFNLWSCLPVLFGKGRKNKVYTSKRKQSMKSDSGKEKSDAIDLELHIALSSGDITNIILGEKHANVKARQDSRIADLTRRASQLFPQLTVMGNEEPSDYALSYKGRLEYAICGPAVGALEDALDVAKAGELSITAEAYGLLQEQGIELSHEKRGEFYVVKKGIGLPASPLEERAYSRRGMRRNATVSTLDSAAAMMHNPDYPKYINQSALYRLQHSLDDNFPAQFRDATIMFISLGELNVASAEGLRTAQRAMRATIRALIKYEGILQQFAVDDKGATLLALFGLPPLSHEREAVFAAKTAIELRDVFSTFLSDFSISLSTGIIFNSVLPQSNPYRRDPAIAGDTIIMAVRMLKFPFAKKNVVCDAATKQQIGRMCDFEDCGENVVKGKVKPIQIFRVLRFATVKNKRVSQNGQDSKHSDFIGYRLERVLATDFFNDWQETPNRHLLVISGQSGVGKSFLCNTLAKMIQSEDTIYCWSSSTEVEKSSKYYLVKNILLALFEIIDSDQVPINRKRRISSFPGTQDMSLESSDFSFSPPSSPTTTLPASSPTHAQINNSLFSGSRMSCDDLSGPLSESSHDLIDLIIRCLKKCGEEEEFLPLFKVVFGTLSNLHDNRSTRRLDVRGRDILLTGVMVRMIRYVSDHIGLVFISDDVQWADSASIRLLQHIHDHCEKVLLILATRPVKDYDVTFIQRFRETGTSQELQLNGLGATEIAEVILQTFQTSAVSSISPEIVSVIQKRTGGNPLYVKNVAIVLKDFDHVTVVDHVLVPSSNRFDLEDLMGNFDYKRIIKMQFDRVNNSFQEFLTVASCLDQHFTIREIQSVMKENNVEFKGRDRKSIQRKIERYDTYRFIKKVEEHVDKTEEEDLYTFTHITIPQGIYDMVSYETRILLHRLLAKHYEAQLTRDNYYQLLPKVTRHYLQTEFLDKQLYYLEALADLNMRSCLLSEATANLERMVKILNNHPEMGELYGRVHQSDIYRRLGMCFTMRTKLTEGEHYLLEALDCLGKPWPRSEPEFVFKFWVNKFSQLKHRKGWCKSHKDPKRREIGRRVVEIMAQLSNIYFYMGKGRAFVYTCLIGLNACERLEDTSAHYTLFLARNSLISWLNDGKEQSIYYITQALKHMDDGGNDPDTLTICAHLCFAAGKFQNASTLLYRSIEGVKTLGVITDCQAYYRSAGLVITMRVFEGSLNQSPDDLALLRQMGDLARANCDFEVEIWLAVYHVSNALITDRLKECEPFVVLLEAHLKQAADYNKIVIHGTLLCYYARCRNFKNARRKFQDFVNSLPRLTVTPNIFPIFGLIFATMGLYCLIEEDEIDFISMGDSKNYSQFIEGISRLNHAFQQVKFWEFTQPCLYLARALPYISTGRIVEGFTVLEHGVMEMQFIQEIRFLKAFYWANLGKYAFTPQDRSEWTERARKDLAVLKIAPHIYCNPDPKNLYSRGRTADFRG